MSLRTNVVRQFQNPHGMFGQLAGWIMANRPSNRERNRWTVDLLDVKAGDRILELGCGPGVGLEVCLARGSDVTVCGLDHSQTMLDQARRRNRAAFETGQLSLVRGDILQAKLEDTKFDKVYSTNVVQFLQDKIAAFHRIGALLAEGGLVATTYMPRHAKANRSDALNMADEIHKNMELAGFKLIWREELPLAPVPALCVLGRWTK